ncbi:MAG: M14 family zinc carboxypeptidase, partial [Chitinophagaceae bacterium]
TYEHRQQIAAVFTTVANHNKLEEIRKAHLEGQLTGATENIPLIIQMGYNIHGNEPSSSEAAMLTAYYLTASEDPETLRWLNEMVILMDPNINPDGRDRHSNWANMHKANPPVGDPLDREHTEVWPGGRFNHYWFDMNRDWFLAVHPESKNRLRFFHHWRPYVQTDHHEMGSNSTFYFDPGKTSSNNPIVPDELYNTIYPKFGEYFSKAMNQIGSMYFTKEAFDKLYPGYGSSYINFYGGAGFLFEQASSRGHLQETSTIPLTFAFTIRNQFVSSLTTIRASLAEKAQLLKMRAAFYRSSAASAKASAVKAYIFGDANDETRTKAFVELLLTHNIDVFDVENTAVYNRQKFEAAKTYIVPVDQPNYIMVRSIFEKGITYTDSLFYDASTWSLIHAYDLPYAELKTAVPRGKKITSITQSAPAVENSNYVYAFDLRDYNAHKVIYHLQSKGVIVQSAFRPFTATVGGSAKTFGYGSVIIPVQLQRIAPDSIFKIVDEAAKSSKLKIYSLGSGFNTGGIDLGSGYVRTLRQPDAMMLVGQGVAATEAGEIWHLLDQRLAMPITKMDITNFARSDISRYNTIVMVSGSYTVLDKPATDKLKLW